MGNEREIDEAELTEVTGDLEQAHRLHRALRTLRDSPSADGPLRQMARDVLAGRVGMRDALRSETCLRALGEGMARLRKADERMTPEEREQRRGQAESFFRAREEAAREEAAGRERSVRPSRPSDSAPVFGLAPRPPRGAGRT